MTLLRAVARQIPTIRRLHDSRNALLAERDALLVERDLLRARESKPAPEDAEAAAMRLACAEGRLIVTDYPYHPKTRAIEDTASGIRITRRLDSEIDQYIATLQGIARHTDSLLRIPRDEQDASTPFWSNDWFPPFDGVALYGLVAERSPRRYIEVGSGNSTRFVRQAIRDKNLATRIVSIDPHPRVEIDMLCDEMIRTPMEDVPRAFWESIGADDMLFIDNSHRSFANSDVTVFFSEVMPALRPGAIWGLHDIFLPWDYPEAWRDRFYNEQYLLLTYLLGGAECDEILLPLLWATHQPRLHGILAPLWAREDLFRGVSTHGGSFWMRKR